MFFKRIKIPKEEVDKAKTYLILMFGNMKEAAYRWSLATKEERLFSYTPAQTEAIKEYFKTVKHRTNGTGPL